MFPKSMLVLFSVFSCCSLFLNLLPLSYENCIFEPIQILHQSFVSIAKFTSLTYRHCIKIIIYDNVSFASVLLFANITNVCKTKHKLFFFKLIQIVLKDNFFPYVL